MAKIIHTPRTGITCAVGLLREMYLTKHSDPNKEDPIVAEMVEVLRKHGFDLDSPDKKG